MLNKFLIGLQVINLSGARMELERSWIIEATSAEEALLIFDTMSVEHYDNDNIISCQDSAGLNSSAPFLSPDHLAIQPSPYSH